MIHFDNKECVHCGNDDCPLTKIDDLLSECRDVECEYYENTCDNCLAYREG